MDIDILNSKNKEKTIEKYADTYFRILTCYYGYSFKEGGEYKKDFIVHLGKNQTRIDYLTKSMREFVKPYNDKIILDFKVV